MGVPPSPPGWKCWTLLNSSAQMYEETPLPNSFPSLPLFFLFISLYLNSARDAISFNFLTCVFRLHKQGAVSLIAMNLYAENEAQVKLDKDLQGLDVDEYLFTPDGNITSRFVSHENRHFCHSRSFHP